jgi:hypothetical protein
VALLALQIQAAELDERAILALEIVPASVAYARLPRETRGLRPPRRETCGVRVKAIASICGHR